ncbi:radical SAM protein [Paraclostridium bifermentans]|uniref:radical SAM protein n=1 Tax=Paraclostridium bifermentans TaxID=1490 RepID=UPI00241D8CDD|nr:radical SAM protein [Paraclostridium bifermentans]
MKKRIFYFNITYGCNNNCVFCYSHNTTHSSIAHNELTLDSFNEYLKRNSVSSDDRIILNGGEPLMHSNLKDILTILKNIGCETIIFTNGRLLNRINLNLLNEKFRFVVPIHGYKELHDKITKVKGSYIETIHGMKKFDSRDVTAKLDLKIILNEGMIESTESFNKMLNALDSIYFNNSVHITKMADTIISKKNNCKSMNNNDIVSYYTRLLFDYFSKYDYSIKLFDTCIKDINQIENKNLNRLKSAIEVNGKDFLHEEIVETCRNLNNCASKCSKRDYCISSVFEYKVLEFSRNQFYENLE